jgi:hypothetical protein
VVYAPELSQLAVLDGIRAGHVFVDVEGSGGRVLELNAQAGGTQAMMGDALAAPAGTVVQFRVRVAQAAGSTISLMMDGAAAELLAQPAVGGDDETKGFSWTSDGQRHWLRADVRDAKGKLLLLGNPVYLNLP